MQVDPDHLTRMLTRLKLTAVRDQLDSLLDEAARGELSIRESLALLCEREIARKDERRVEMGLGLARGGSRLCAISTASTLRRNPRSTSSRCAN